MSQKLYVFDDYQNLIILKIENCLQFSFYGKKGENKQAIFAAVFLISLFLTNNFAKFSVKITANIFSNL